MLYSMLPSAVKSRLPRLPSLRRSVSLYALAPRRKRADERPGTGSSTSSGVRTPDGMGGYRGAMVLSGMGEEEMVDYYTVESLGTSDDEVEKAKDGKERQRQERRMELTENVSGIGWKFANQGTS